MIAVCGMVGVGKTTYVSQLAEYFASEAYYESVDKNPILEKFYREPEAYSFMSQVYFLATRFAATKKASAFSRALIDRAMEEDVLFAQVNHDLGRISAEEKIVYDTLATNLLAESKTFPNKNLYILLTASFDTILSRIAKRDRSFEQDPALKEYYRALHLRYDDWMKANIPPGELLIIDTDKHDIMNRDQRLEIFNTIVLKMQAVGI